MDMKDVITTSYTNNSTKINMILTHEPTMTIVQGAGTNRFTLKVKLMAELIRQVTGSE